MGSAFGPPALGFGSTTDAKILVSLDATARKWLQSYRLKAPVVEDAIARNRT
jgi:hypothetical protein